MTRGIISTWYLIYRTAFHGGSLVSRHRSRAAAERALARYKRGHGECTCGGAGIVPPGGRVGTRRDQDPYAIGLED